MNKPKPNLAKYLACVAATIVIGITFFFAIVGVFGLGIAIGGVALAILFAGVIIRRSTGGEDLL